MKTPFAEKLFLLRNEKEFTRRYMADSLCTHIKTYQNWEYGNAEPSFSHLAQISQLLGVSIDYLLSDYKSPTL